MAMKGRGSHLPDTRTRRACRGGSVRQVFLREFGESNSIRPVSAGEGAESRSTGESFSGDMLVQMVATGDFTWSRHAQDHCFLGA